MTCDVRSEDILEKRGFQSCSSVRSCMQKTAANFIYKIMHLNIDA